MKFNSALTWGSIAAFVTVASAQGTYIRNPTAGAGVHKGENIVFQLVRPMSHQGSIEVGLALSFQTCPNGACPDPKNELGFVLFTGQYRPQLHEIPGNPYQNFTLTIPNQDFLQPGKARLVVNRFHIIGGGPSAFLDTSTVEVNLLGY